MIKVFCTAPVGRFIDKIKLPKNINLRIHEYAEGNDLRNGIKWCNAHISNARVKLTKDILQWNQNLKKIYQPSIGHDNIDRTLFDSSIEINGLWNEKNFRKKNLTTAEHTLSLILALIKEHKQAQDDVLKNGSWDNRKYFIKDLQFSTIGIVGFGNVGSGLATLLKGFGCQMISYDPLLEERVFKKYKVKKVSYKSLLNKSDIITFHTPLNKSTKNLFSFLELQNCKKNPLLINCARGGIVNEQVILKGLKNKKISGYACDVLENENPRGMKSNRIVKKAKKNRKIIVTPHIGGSSYRYMREIFTLAFKYILKKNK